MPKNKNSSPTGEDIIENRMALLRQRYLSVMKKELSALKSYLTRSVSKPLTQQERDEIHYLAHKFMGSGETFGFPQVTKTGSALEEQLLMHPPCKDTVVLEKLKKFLAACDDAQKKGV